MLANAKPQLEKGSVATEYAPCVEYTTYLDLKGNELYGLDETYRDILRIDANRHAVIEKRTQVRTVTAVGTLTINNGGTDYASLMATPAQSR